MRALTRRAAALYTSRMPGFVLLILLIACCAAVIAAFAYLGWRGFKLGKNAIRVGRDMGGAVQRLAPALATLHERSLTMAEGQARLATALTSLQESMKRFGAVASLLGEALAPLRRARSFFRG